MISVIIPSWNGYHLLKTCLPALLNQRDANFEVIVVDNGSSDSTVEKLQKTFPEVVCVPLAENRGFCGAVNEGIRMAGTNAVVLLNNDTTVQPGWLSTMVGAMHANPDYNLFCCKVLISSSPDRIDTVGDGFTVAGFGYKKFWLCKETEVPKEPFEVFGGSGCALLICREVIDRIGLFDEDFFAFGEDLDYAFRARLAGFRVLSVPKAVIHHDVRATAAGESTLFWYHRNLLWLILKNYPWQLILIYSPHIISHVLLVLLRSSIHGWWLTYLRSIYAAVRQFPVVLAKRRRIQQDRTASIKELRRHLDLNWPGIHMKLHKAKKRLSILG